MSESIPCPSCHNPMETRVYQRAGGGAPGGEAALDICWPCQGIWFDAHESTQLAPAGVIALFRQIHEHRDEARPNGERLNCPRCRVKLEFRRDIARSGRFAYHRCPSGDGRYTPFNQFLIEKGFVRALTPAEITTLKATIQTIRCSGCGAPVDIQHNSACEFCKSPIAILDAQAVEKALAAYGQAEQARAVRVHDVVAETGALAGSAAAAPAGGAGALGPQQQAAIVLARAEAERKRYDTDRSPWQRPEPEGFGAADLIAISGALIFGLLGN